MLIDAVHLEITNNPLQNKEITAIVRDTGLDRKTLEAGFKLIFRLTINKYQTEQKLKYSQQLLDAGLLTVKEIAFKCGYESHSNYSKAFKKLFGKTPSDWQNSLVVNEYRSLPLYYCVYPHVGIQNNQSGTGNVQSMKDYRCTLHMIWLTPSIK
jgi:AraC-like DNA-binding protein